jgi:hypothetical protein
MVRLDSSDWEQVIDSKQMRQAYDLTDLLPLKTRPMTAAAIPPISNHMDWSVGVPVKKRDISEPNESEALIPKTINARPATTNASPNALFMICLSLV